VFRGDCGKAGTSFLAVPSSLLEQITPGTKSAKTAGQSCDEHQ
jgi:hypothetical protein